MKQAARENLQIVKWFSDEAISGDTSTGARPGLAALLRGAQAGEFSVVLAWHTNRVSREDPMDALVFYNQLRKADVGLITCCEGRIDLEDFAKQLLLFVNQKANNDYPSPRGTGWTHTNVIRLLTTKAYIGTTGWGFTSWGKYHVARGEDIVSVNSKDNRWHRKPEEEVIFVEGTHRGIVDPEQFDRVQRKMNCAERPRQTAKRREFPLRGLLFCKHCGKPMQGETGRGRDRQGRLAYQYLRYVCGTYQKFGKPDGIRNRTCGHHAIDAERVLRWLTRSLQEVFLGPGRGVLVEGIKRQLQSEAKTADSDLKRLEARAAKLEREVSRLVKAIRTLDAPELVEELEVARRERRGVQDALQQAGRFQDGENIDREAEAFADELWSLGERLSDSDPAVLREVLRRFVSRIECRWEQERSRSGRLWYKLAKGKVFLREQALLDVYGVVGRGSESTVR